MHHHQRLTEPQPKSTAKDHVAYADRPSTTKIVITSPDRHYHGAALRGVYGLPKNWRTVSMNLLTDIGLDK